MKLSKDENKDFDKNFSDFITRLEDSMVRQKLILDKVLDYFKLIQEKRRL